MYPTPPFQRSDFVDVEDYLRALREGGFEPTSNELRKYATAGGESARLFRAILGVPEIVTKPRRSSDYLSGSEVRKVYNAVAFSNRMGVVLNVHLTIVWSTVCPSQDSYEKCLRSFQELCRKWCSERQVPFHGVYCWEKGVRNGLHSHLLMHVPRIYQDDFGAWASRAVKTITGRAAVVHPRSRLKKTSPSTLRIVHRRETEVGTQWRLFRYIMKGVYPKTAVRSVLEGYKPRKLAEIFKIQPRKQGKVSGKRVGIFRAIDADAQKRAGFRSAFDEGVVTTADLLTDAYLTEFHRDCEQRELDAMIGKLKI